MPPARSRRPPHRDHSACCYVAVSVHGSPHRGSRSTRSWPPGARVAPLPCWSERCEGSSGADMTAVRSGPAHAAPARTTGRHARVESGMSSGPLVPLRTVVPLRSGVPAPPEPAAGRLVIDSSYSRLTPYLGARKVAVSIDGLPWRFAWGRTPIDLPAGRHLVEIE